MGARIGLVSLWFNRGQATVARQLRSVLEHLGHETHVLARPTRESFFLPRHTGMEDVWDQQGVTRASRNLIPVEEYVAWARGAALDVVFFDQNYQFQEIGALRAMGVRTIGRFVWESFDRSHARPAQLALDTIYAVTRCEQQRYASMGIDAPFVRWGCHPELVSAESPAKREHPTFFYPAGYLSERKPTAAVIEAFRRAKLSDARLIIKAQRPLRRCDLIVPGSMDQLKAARRDPSMRTEMDGGLGDGVEVITDNLSADAYARLFRSCHVCLAPSRWEGLGLHLFEATAFGLPVICNDMAPLNEVILDGRNGRLTACRQIGRRRNGLPSLEPDPDDLARAMRETLQPSTHAKLTEGALARRAELTWEHTIADCRALLEG